MSSSDDGAEIERHAIRILKAHSYAIDRATRKPRWTKKGWRNPQANDFLGCVDIIAKKKGERMRFIQVTKGRNVGRKKKRLATVPWDTQFESVEIWRWIGGAGKRKDGRNNKLRARMYFQVYRLDRDFELDKSDRIMAESK